MGGNLSVVDKLQSLVLYSDVGNIASQTQFEKFEAEYSIKLPLSFKLFQEKFNGVILKDAYFKIKSPHTNRLDEFSISFLKFEDHPHGIEQTNRRMDPAYMTEGIIIFGRTGSDFLCFDYSCNTLKEHMYPKISVMFYDHWTDEKSTIVSVADSFDDFVNKIYEYVDPEEQAYRDKNKIF